MLIRRPTGWRRTTATPPGGGIPRKAVIDDPPLSLSAAIPRPPANIRPARLAGSGYWYLALLLAAGCLPVRPPPVAPPADPAIQPDASSRAGTASPTVFDRSLQRLTVEFKVHRYSAPRGLFSGNPRLWRLAAIPLGDAATVLRLADNGLRGGVGQASDREPLRLFLAEVPGLRSALDYAQPDHTRAVEVDLGPTRPRTVVFYYTPGGGLRGMDFVDARSKLRLAYELRSISLREVGLQVIPELEEPPGPPQWVITEAGARQEPEDRRYVFTELALSVKIPEDGFLLLGPTEGVHDRPLLGGALFVQSRGDDVEGDAAERESILIISPVVRSTVEPSLDGGPRPPPDGGE